MQAVKALYKHGNIELLEPLKGVEEAELFIIVLDKNEKNSDAVQAFVSREKKPEQEFKAIGLASYFETDEDNNVDWEEVFDVKAG
ncbi:MAG: hypothetical protein Q9N02_11595 [Ghiorsea sp.]|nr:hypothetical protein [Ghiorsea sp.]